MAKDDAKAADGLLNRAFWRWAFQGMARRSYALSSIKMRLFLFRKMQSQECSTIPAPFCSVRNRKDVQTLGVTYTAYRRQLSSLIAEDLWHLCPPGSARDVSQIDT